MNAFEDVLYDILGVWIAILLFITAPLWGVPYILIQRIKNR